MYFLTMLSPRRIVRLVVAGLCVVALAGCGGTSDVSSVTGAAASAEAAEDAVDHADDGDEDHDEHGDEDHEDEDHDEHGDEDHEDEDHEDEDHDEHGDDHDDEDHDEHGEDHDVSGGLDAHVHGAGELFVAVSGGDVVVDLISPAFNIFGFEYEPVTDDEKSFAAERIDALAQSGMLAFNASAGCTVVGDVEPELVVEGSHAEVVTSWTIVCENPDEISELDATELFAEFPAFLDIDAQWVSESGQSAAELSPSSTVLRFE